MIFDLGRDTPPATEHWVCIVGAGAAGISLASELHRRGRSVLLLEGGGAFIEAQAQEPYRSEIVGLDHRGIHEGRFRAYGGTTTKWGGQILELDEIDFEKRDWIPSSGWPFPKDRLRPYYARALEVEGIAGAIQDDDEVWAALKLPKPNFEGLESYCSRWCPEPNFARLHRTALEGPGVHVWLHANAVELLWKDGKAIGLRCRTQTGIEAVFQAEQYVFCLGAIESSRFFLQPLTHCSELPWNRSGLLGKHFQDHIDCNAARVIPRSRAAFHNAFDDIYYKGYKYTAKLRMPATAEREATTLNTASYMHYPEQTSPELEQARVAARRLLSGDASEFRLVHSMRVLHQAPLILRKALRFALRHRAYRPPSAEIALRVHSEQEPGTQSSLSLSEERDSLGLFRTRLDWRISELELRSIRHYVATAKHALASIAEIMPNPMLMSGDREFLGNCEDTNHHMSGMRMHASSAMGLVNEDLLLHETRNCFVCSSAVFPTSGFSNPTHTIIALGMKLAEFLDR